MKFRDAHVCRDTRTTGGRSFPARVAFHAQGNGSRQFCEVYEDDESFATFKTPFTKGTKPGPQKAQNLLQEAHQEIYLFVLVANSPTVVRGVAGLDGHERAATSRADFVVRDQLAFDDRFVIS